MINGTALRNIAGIAPAARDAILLVEKDHDAKLGVG